MEGVFIELSVIIILAAIFAGVMRFLGQPLIIGYILAGIAVNFIGFIPQTNNIQTFAHIGIAILLFMVGLNLNPKIVKDAGKIALTTGIGQVAFTTILGFIIGKLLGFSTLTSFYLALAVSFSSTIIIMKLLSDKGDMESLYGRISIGFLIVQDIIAVFVLLFISSLSSGIDISRLIFETLFTGMGLILCVVLLAIFVLPKITNVIAKSQEFLLLFSIAWCFTLSTLFYYFKFSIEIGALLAGISLSLSPYRYEIVSRMKPLRDFFLVLFFIYLGTQFGIADVSSNLAAIIGFSLLILIGNPLIVMLIMGAMGYTKRNSFLAGLTVSQISEFSLILVALGVSLGQIPTSALSIITAVGIITIGGCTYLVSYSNKIYPLISKYLSIFEKKGEKVDEHKYHHEHPYDIILFGYNRTGYDLLASFKKLKREFLIVDYNPDTIKNLAKEGFHCRYGDAGDSELLGDLALSKSRMVISTIPDMDTNLLLIRKIRETNKKTIIIVISHQIDEAIDLYDEGASYVIMPHLLGGLHASTLIEDNKLDVNKFLKHKIAHIEYLKKRKEMGNIHNINESHQ